MITSFIKKTKDSISEHTLALSLSVYLLIESHPAFAFSQVFTGKLGELRNGLILIGKACVGVALVAALFKFLTNQGGNWKWIGSICGVGCALIGINILVQFMGGS
ncbi:hypothetical protein IM40_11245 (plasmid) [Candidatus Paracaedimonas acanthamoebae]|nr:hypothetical protein IM40_09225 [Candidatus Paracaedimonas acanthamoebae]AIL13905.1 hypothetical protein IM40_11245 [Candidatus Paracaedimonas acanthamoebae]